MRGFIATSLETHLFFGRIMKEHALFLLADHVLREANHYLRILEET